MGATLLCRTQDDNPPNVAHTHHRPPPLNRQQLIMPAETVRLVLWHKKSVLIKVDDGIDKQVKETAVTVQANHTKTFGK